MRHEQRIEAMEDACEPGAIVTIDADEVAYLSFDRSMIEDHRLDEGAAGGRSPHDRVQLSLFDVRVIHDAAHQIGGEQTRLIPLLGCELRQSLDDDPQLSELSLDAVVLGTEGVQRLCDLDGRLQARTEDACARGLDPDRWAGAPLDLDGGRASVHSRDVLEGDRRDL